VANRQQGTTHQAQQQIKRKELKYKLIFHLPMEKFSENFLSWRKPRIFLVLTLGVIQEWHWNRKIHEQKTKKQILEIS